MSTLKINAFCNFMDDIIIKNENTEFMVNGRDIKSLVSNHKCNLPINEFIQIIMDNNLYIYEYIDGVILYTVNILILIKSKGLYLNYRTAHRILLVTLMLACKIYIDDHYENESWANISGLKIRDINKMEITILKLLNINLFITISPNQSLFIYKSIY